MGLKDTWVDKVDTTTGLDGDDIMAEDINAIAQQAIQNERDLENKVEKENGKGLSTNDFTNELKEKLEGIPENEEEEQVQADWNQDDETQPDYVKNRTHYIEYISDDYGELEFEQPVAWDNGMKLSSLLTINNNYVIRSGIIVGETYVITVEQAEWHDIFDVKASEIKIGESFPRFVPALWFEGLSDNGIINQFLLYEDNGKVHIDACLTDGSEVKFVDEKLIVTIEGNLKFGKAKPIDERFIPNSIARVADVENSKLKNTASGDAMKLTDSADGKAHILNVYGKTTQNGTPTPNAPIELESVGESVEVSVYDGKNLIPYPYNPSMALTQNGITLAINEDGSIVANGIATTNTQFFFYHYLQSTIPISLLPNTEYTLSGCVGGSSTTYELRVSDNKTTACISTNKGTVFSYADTSQITVSILVRSGAVLNNVVFKPQIEVGSATPYTPYKAPTTYTVQTPNGLRGIKVTSGGNYTDSNGQQWITDEIDYNRGVYIQRIKKVVLNGSERWVRTAAYNNETEYVFYYTLPDIKDQGSNNSGVLCSHLPVGVASTHYGTEDACYIMQRQFRMHITGMTTVADAKDWLNSNNMTICYALETPIETPLTAEMIEAYTHYPTTTILSDKAGLKIGYVADTKNYIDNKFAQLETALLSIAD